MYFGSVRFYKHLIYTVMVIISILAIIGFVFLISLIIPESDVHAEAITYNDSMTSNSDSVVDPNNNFSYNDDINSNENEAKNDSLSSNNQSSDTEKTHENKNDDTDKININEENTDDSNEQTEAKNFDLYPELVCDEPVVEKKRNKTAYLTFDDGPSTSTLAILDILKEYDVKATFFVVTGSYNSSNLYLLNDILEQGHAIGIHSNTHEYTKIYESLDSYLEDLNNAYNAIYNQTGIRVNIVRLPGGSINSFNEVTKQEITDELLDRNFRYYDWNVSFQDAKKNITADEIYQNALSGINKLDGEDLIILAHDYQNNDQTLIALKKVIATLSDLDYEFGVINNTVEPITFSGK